MDVVQVIQLVLSGISALGICLGIYWQNTKINALKGTVEAQKESIEAHNRLIESLKGSAEFQRSLQESAQRLYDPKEIENIVTARTERVEEEYKRKFKATLGAVSEVVGEKIDELFAKQFAFAIAYSCASRLLTKGDLVFVRDFLRDTGNKENNSHMLRLADELDTLAPARKDPVEIDPLDGLLAEKADPPPSEGR